MRHHLAVIALVALAAIGCGGDPARPDEAALARLREHFLYDDVVRWVRDRVQQSALQTALAERGFALDGSGRQGEQAVDGFTRGLGAGTSTVPLAGLTAVYDSAGTVSSLTVVALSPPLQEQAEALVKLSRSSTEARSGGPAASMLYLLGAERLAPERLLRTSVRLDKQRTQVYSIMYAVAAE